MEREVIVVGAGPGGATTAAALAREGRDVLLIDKNAFPRDKICGDAVPAGAIEILYDLGAKEKVLQSDFYMVNKLLIQGRKGDRLEADLHVGKKGADSYVIPRVKFDHLIQQHAVDVGAEFCKGQVTEPILEDDKVVGVRVRHNGQTVDVRAKMVVGADGVTSVITRRLRPEKNQHRDGHRAVALRAYLEGIEEYPHEVEFYLYKGILPGYAWIFPIGEGKANIGLGMRLDKFRRLNGNLKEMLQVFLDMPAIKERLHPGYKLEGVRTWQLNFGSQKGLQHAFNGALLVGDAAGFINPLTGGGIHNAMISAILAKETIQEAFAANDFSAAFLKRYEARCHEAMWPGMRRAYWFQVMLGRAPFIVDLLIRRMRSDSHFAQAFLEKL